MSAAERLRTPPHLNALHPVTLTAAGNLTLHGFSISGIATWLMVPELDVCFDMGECALPSLGMNHVLLSHVHGDHDRCLARHWQLRAMFGQPPAHYFVPEESLHGIEGCIRAEAYKEGVAPADVVYPNLHPLAPTSGDVPLPGRKDLWVRPFVVTHRVPSLGYTIGRTKRKLLPAYVGVPGDLLAQLRRGGTVIDAPVREPLLTFIGDSDREALWREGHIWQSPVLILECTYIEDHEDPLAERSRHTNLHQIAEVLRSPLGEGAAVQTLVLKHFSARHEPARIRERVAEAIPASWLPRTKLLLPDPA